MKRYVSHKRALSGILSLQIFSVKMSQNDIRALNYWSKCGQFFIQLEEGMIIGRISVQ